MARRGADAPVAVSQEGMLWHERFVPGSFNLPCLVRRYRGPLDVAALEAALTELVRRHQPLRSTFSVDDGRPVQIVGDGRAFALPVVDLGDLPPDDRDREVADHLADASGRPFDLAAGPLFEPRIVRLGHDDHLFVVRLHHTVFDDWSVDVFRRELSALYSARVCGAPSPLVEPPATFADVCRRRRSALGGGRGADQLAWWRRELAGAPLAVQLPIGDGAVALAAEPLRFDLPAPLAAALRELARRLRATPYMTVLAAFSVLLSRITAQEDLVIATVVAHRDESDVEPLIGCFTKKVPLRLRFDGDPTFTELVARTRASLLGSLARQDVAFDAAIQAGLGGAAAAHGVVPQIAVVFQAEAPQRVRMAMPNLTIGPYDVNAGRAERHFSAGPDKAAVGPAAPLWGDGIYLGTFLILSLLDTGDGLALIARGVFSRPVTRLLLEDLRVLLEAAVTDPAQPISGIGIGIGATGPDAVAGDEMDVRGFRVSRPRLQAALARCPGVADVAVAAEDDADGARRLVAYVVAAEGEPAPTLTDLRRAVWATHPGALWPAEALLVDAVPDCAAERTPVEAGADPLAATLRALWAEAGGGAVEAGRSYWQDFSFLPVVSAARKAGLDLGDEQVMRCRTVEMLAATLPAPRP